MKVLAEARWPISEQEILLMEDEIIKGERYLQQSKDLRKAANQDNSDDELTVYSDKASNVSGLSARSKDLSRSKDSLSSKDSSRSQSSRSSSSSHHSDVKSSVKGSIEVIPNS